MFGTTGYAFIRQAWEVLRRIDYDRSVIGGRRAYTTEEEFNVALTDPNFPGQTRGSRWDNDFNRALWAWTLLQWEGYNSTHGLPSAIDQLNPLTGATSPQQQGWVSLLNTIEQCERTQQVSEPALGTALVVVLHSLGLIASTTEQHVYFEPNTLTIPYGVDPPLPPLEARDGERRFATWSRSSPPTTSTPSPAAVDYVTQQPDPPRPQPGQGGGSTGGGSTGWQRDDSQQPDGEVELSATQKSFLSAGYAVGGLLLIAGAVNFFRSRDR